MTSFDDTCSSCRKDEITLAYYEIIFRIKRKILCSDLTGNGFVNIFTSPHSQIAGLVEWDGGNFSLLHIKYDWINTLGGAGNEGWNLRSNDTFFPADLDGSGKPNVIVVNGNGQWIGVLSYNITVSEFQAIWIKHDWVNHPGGSGSTGWNLRSGDLFSVLDINGDGKQEIIVRSANGKWIGILEPYGSGLAAGWIESNWINTLSGSGNEGWHMRRGDLMLPINVSSDPSVELLVLSPDRQWIGLLEYQASRIVAKGIKHDWVNSQGGSGNEGWNLRSNDEFYVGDIDNDGMDEIVVVNGSGDWIGVLSWNGNRFAASGILHYWVNSQGGSGNEGWNLKAGDRYYMADIDNDGAQEIIVISPNGQWIGVLSWNGSRLVSSGILHDWVNSPGNSGNEGWNLRSNDQLYVGDIDNDGMDEILILSGNYRWRGILKWSGSRLEAIRVERQSLLDWIPNFTQDIEDQWTDTNIICFDKECDCCPNLDCINGRNRGDDVIICPHLVGDRVGAVLLHELTHAVDGVELDCVAMERFIRFGLGAGGPTGLDTDPDSDWSKFQSETTPLNNNELERVGNFVIWNSDTGEVWVKTTGGNRGGLLFQDPDWIHIY